MKRLFSIFMLILLLPCFAAAENAITLVTPMPSAPAGVEFSCESFIVRLPVGMQPMEEADLTGYEAAMQSAFPGTAQTLLAAINPENNSALCFALADSVLSADEAAREAASHILGSPDSAQPFIFGTNSAAGFACAVQDTTFRIYFFSNGSRLLLAAITGLGDAEVDAMLASLDF